MDKETLIYSADGLTIEGCDPEYCWQIIIPEGVTKINGGAFQNSKVSEIVTPHSLIEIGRDAFKGCKNLSRAILKDGLTKINDSAFEECVGLVAIDLPTSLESIGNHCFEKTNLQYVKIPSTLCDIKYRAFAFTNAYFEVADGNLSYSAEDGSLFDKAQQTLIKYYCTHKHCRIDKPIGLRVVDSNAFSGCHIMKSIELSDSIEKIGSFAFYGCQNLEKIVLPKKIKIFESAARCPKLKEVILPKGLTEIKACAFEGCESLEQINLPSSLEYIGNNWQGQVFCGCISLKSITIPPKVELISSSCFAGCKSLTEVIISEGVKEIGYNAFGKCESLTSIHLPESLTIIGNSAFEGCTSLIHIEIPTGVQKIGASSFKNCIGLESVYVATKMQSFPYGCFEGCNSLIKVTLPIYSKEMLYTTFADSSIKEIHTLDSNQKIDPAKDLKDFENELRMASMFYHNNNMNITKIRGNLSNNKSFKTPDASWEYELEEFYNTKQSSGFILKENWFRSSGIGLVLGWNNYHAIDVDNIAPFYVDHLCENRKHMGIFRMVKECLSILGLPEDYPWVVSSGSRQGFHIIFQTNDNVDDTIGSIAYTPNSEYLWDYGNIVPERVFQRMELRWKDHLILPPSIHISGNQYEFFNNEYPSCTPATISIGTLDNMINHFCGRIVFTSFNYKNRNFELVELGKYYAQYDSWSYDPEHKDDNVSWLEHSGTPESLNTLGIKYILGRGVEADKAKALEYLEQSECDLAYFNLASLYACGYFSGSIELVELYLSKIKNDPIFLNVTEIEDEEGNLIKSYNHFPKIRENALRFTSNGDLYLFFDTETTGLPKKYDAPSSNLSNWPRLVQLSWIVCDSIGNKLYSKDYIIKPNGFSIPQDSAKVHGITTEMAKRDGIELSLVLDEFVNDCEHVQMLVGHNIDFDKKVIGAELIRIDKDDTMEEFPSICTMKSTIDYCKIRNFFGYKYPSLQELYQKLFGCSFEGAHNSASDIDATFECFWELKKQKIIK